MTVKIPLIENVGTGSGQIFKQETASNTHQLKRIAAGASISVTDGPSDITITYTGATGATTAVLEDHIFAVTNSNFNGIGADSANLGNAGINPVLPKVTTGSDNIPWFWKPPRNLDTGLTLQVCCFGYVKTRGNGNNNTIRLYSRYHAHDEDCNVAFVNTADLTWTSAATLRAWVTAYTNITPDGAYGADKMLIGRFDRTDAEANEFLFVGAKIKYRITL